MHAERAPEWAAQLGVIAPRAAVHAIALLVVVIGGRVTPAFTRNALPNASVRASGARDAVAIGSAGVALGLASLAAPPAALAASACALAALANAARMRGWATRAALTDPLLWILHAGYAWLVLGFALSGVAAWAPGRVAPSAALHAFSTGAVGTYVLGMMSRVALGHTGRPLALPRPMRIAFAAILVAGAVRVALPIAAPTQLAFAWELAGALWCVAFGLFLVAYARILVSPRPDGKPG